MLKRDRKDLDQLLAMLNAATKRFPKTVFTTQCARLRRNLKTILEADDAL